MAESRLEEAEKVLEICAAALRFVPVRVLRKGITWMPSDKAIEIIADAKDELDKYAKRHSLKARD